MTLLKLGKSDIPLLLAISSASLIGLGLLTCFAYYNNFGITIFSYIDLSEAILFLFGINSMYFVILLMVFITFLVVYPVPQKVFTPVKQLQWVESSSIWFRRLMLIILAFFCVWHISIYFLKVDFWIYKLSRTLDMLLLVYWLVISGIELWTRRALIFFFALIFTAYSGADTKANEAIKYPRKVLLQLNDNTFVKSSSDTLYVGNTKNYHFFFIPKTHSSLIIKTESVESAVISNLY